MNTRDLIKKSGLTLRELLVLKTNYLAMKRAGIYKFHRLPPVYSLPEYILGEAKACGGKVKLAIVIVLLLVIKNHYAEWGRFSDGNAIIIICIICFIAFILAMKENLNTNSSTVFKLTLLRAMQIIYRVK